MRKRSLVSIAFVAALSVSTLDAGCTSSVDGIGVDDPLVDGGSTGRPDSLATSDAPSGHDAPPSSLDSSKPSPIDSGTTPVDSGGTTIDTGAPAVDSGETDDDRHCVDVINGYRAKVGKPPLARSAALEAFATEGAKSDAATGTPHGHFTATSGGGVAWAENEVPGWPLADSGSVRAVIDEGTKAMWDEGPGGGHYENIIGDWTQVGCGTFVTASGDVWVTQDFR